MLTHDEVSASEFINVTLALVAGDELSKVTISIPDRVLKL